MHRRYAVLFALLALSCAALALMGRVSLLFGWCAITFAVLAVAYAAQRPGLFGKLRPWRLLATLALLPYHLLMHLSWRLAIRGGSPAASRIAPGLWLGRWPLRGCLPPGVERIVDLTAEMPIPPHAARIDYRCLPTLDKTAPDIAAGVALVDALSADPRPTLVHCAMGHGRSPVIVIALLMRQGQTFDAALAQVQRLRPAARLSPAQADAARAIGAARR